MEFTYSTNYLWLALAVLVLGSIYLIIVGYKVHKLFADSIVGKLIRALVVVFLIELYSLGVLSYAFIYFYHELTNSTNFTKLTFCDFRVFWAFVL